MGKAKGPKRKEAPARKRLQTGNSGLVDKQNHRRRNGGVYHSPGINGEYRFEVLGDEYTRTPLRVVSTRIRKVGYEALNFTSSRVNQVVRSAANTLSPKKILNHPLLIRTIVPPGTFPT